MNDLKLTGYFNNIKEIGLKTKVANFSYSIKNKDGIFNNIFIEVYFSKDLEIKKNTRYIISGFLVGDIWIDKKTGKERNNSKIRINSIKELREKENYKNYFKIKGYVSNLKSISDKISIFRLSYPIKMKDNTIKYIYVDSLISNELKIENKKNILLKVFLLVKFGMIKILIK